MDKLSVGIFLFDQVEVLDFAGPFEVFSRTRLSGGSRRDDTAAPFNVLTVAKEKAPINATGGLTVTPDYGFSDLPDLDLLLLPGGFGTRPLLNDEETLDWVANQAKTVTHLTSVCTGSLLYARCGFLRDKRATTHWAAWDELAKIDPTITVEREARYVDDVIVSSAGVSAGIDMAFYMVAKLCGDDVAKETAHYIDYPYNP